jgi:hypothetical protein
VRQTLQLEDKASGGNVVFLPLLGGEVARKRTLEVVDTYEVGAAKPARHEVSFTNDVSLVGAYGLLVAQESGVGRTRTFSLSNVGTNDLASLLSPETLGKRIGAMEVGFELQDRREKNIDVACAADVSGTGGGIEIEMEWADQGRLLARSTTVAKGLETILNGASQVIDVERSSVVEVTAVERHPSRARGARNRRRGLLRFGPPRLARAHRASRSFIRQPSQARAARHCASTVETDEPITAATCFDLEPREEAQLDEARLALVDLRELDQRGVDVKEVVGTRITGGQHVRDRHAFPGAGSGGLPRPRVIDEHLAHRPRGEREEVRAVVDPLERLRAEQLEERLVHERGRLERVARVARPEVALGDRAQLRHDRGQESLDGSGSPGPEVAQSDRQVGSGIGASGVLHQRSMSVKKTA